MIKQKGLIRKHSASVSKIMLPLIIHCQIL